MTEETAMESPENRKSCAITEEGGKCVFCCFVALHFVTD